jgi:hypothetical protein
MILVLGVWAFLRALLGRSTAVTLGVYRRPPHSRSPPCALAVEMLPGVEIPKLRICITSGDPECSLGLRDSLWSIVEIETLKKQAVRITLVVDEGGDYYRPEPCQESRGKDNEAIEKDPRGRWQADQ